MAATDPLLLPPAGDQVWILDELAALVRARGPAHPLVAPLVVATPEFLPDRWVGGAASVRRLLRRLLIYADVYTDLPASAVEVEVYAADDERPRVGRPTGSLASVADLWLAEASPSRLRFGVEAGLLGDYVRTAAAAARAVADAFRRFHRLASTPAVPPNSPDAPNAPNTPANPAAEEQRRIDLAAVYLGFGRLTADAAHRYPRGENRPQRQGVLSPRALCFALAAIVHARGATRPEVKAVARGLQPNQRAFFREALARLAETEPSMTERLGLPPGDAWPAPPDLEELRAPFTDEADDPSEVTAAAEDRGIVGKNAGKPVFRVERRAGLRIARTVVMACVMLGGLATRPQMGEILTMEQVVAGAIVLGGAALLLGSLLRERRCSEPKCGAPLSLEAAVCPRCGGTVMGAIGHPRERLAAEEALQRPELASTGGDRDRD